MRQPIDYLGAPPLLGLPRQNIAADLPVQPHHLSIDRQHRTLLRGVNAVLQVADLADRCGQAKSHTKDCSAIQAQGKRLDVDHTFKR